MLDLLGGSTVSKRVSGTAEFKEVASATHGEKVKKIKKTGSTPEVSPEAAVEDF